MHSCMLALVYVLFSWEKLYGTELNNNACSKEIWKF